MPPIRDSGTSIKLLGWKLKARNLNQYQEVSIGMVDSGVCATDQACVGHLMLNTGCCNDKDLIPVS